MRRIARQGWRQLLVLLVVLLSILFLVKNLLMMQVLQAGSIEMQKHYRDEVVSVQTVQPVRGTIVDDAGRPLVDTVTVYKLSAYPPVMDNGAQTDRIKARVATALAAILYPLEPPPQAWRTAAEVQAARQSFYNKILAQLTRPFYVCLAGADSPTCPLHQDVSQAVAQAIRKRITDLGIPGIDLEPRSTPYYPNGPLAAQILGFVTYKYPSTGSAVDWGQYGVEESYNDKLSGVPGRTGVREDTAGNAIRVGPGTGTVAQQGAQVKLTLDSFVQSYIVEPQLNYLMKHFKAESGSIVVERPSDGAIIALAAAPSYDPRSWQDLAAKGDFSRFLNPAIGNVYTPGSTFKSLLTGIGYDSGYINENSTINDPGIITTDGITIQNWCQYSCTFGGPETTQTMLHYSSNIAATLFAKKIPTDTFYQYLDRFGFGQATGIDLPGEIPGTLLEPYLYVNGKKVPNNSWYPAYRDTTAYGQGGIAVTPLQMANAYAVLANGGYLMQPHVVQSYTLGGKTTVIKPRVIRKVFQDPNTAGRVTDTLVASVPHGEACDALVPGYDVAAKTGTTLYDLRNQNLTIASTAAYGPINQSPANRFVVLIELKHPNVTFGSETVAPAVGTVMQQLFQHYMLEPDPHHVQPGKMCAGPLDPRDKN